MFRNMIKVGLRRPASIVREYGSETFRRSLADRGSTIKTFMTVFHRPDLSGLIRPAEQQSVPRRFSRCAGDALTDLPGPYLLRPPPPSTDPPKKGARPAVLIVGGAIPPTVSEVASGASISVSAGGDHADHDGAAAGDPYRRSAGATPRAGHGWDRVRPHHPQRPRHGSPPAP